MRGAWKHLFGNLSPAGSGAGKRGKAGWASSGAAFKELKIVEKLYIGAGWSLSIVFFVVGAGLLATVPVQARPFIAEQTLAALVALAVGGYLAHVFAGKKRLAGARASLERDPSGFIEAHGYAKSLRADGDFEMLTARVSVLSGLHSIVSRRFAEVLSSYLTLYRKYEPDSVRWRTTLRSLDERVQARFAGKLAGDERSVRQFADEGGSGEDLRAQALSDEVDASEDEGRPAAMEESRTDG